MVAPIVLVSGTAFREKVRMALGWFIAHKPRTAKAYTQYCTRRRQALGDPTGHFAADDELVDDYEFPPLVPDMLRMSEMQSRIQYGIPCGIGIFDWEDDRKLMAIFRDECSIGNLTTMRGDCQGGPG